MGMRSIPVGEQDCYAYNAWQPGWRRLHDLPAGKNYPTLTVVNSRFIFQIGGFEDVDFKIYRLDMQQPLRPWKTLTLDLDH